MNTAETTFLSALALSSPLWLAVIVGKISEHRSRKNKKTTIDYKQIALAMNREICGGDPHKATALLQTAINAEMAAKNHPTNQTNK